MRERVERREEGNKKIKKERIWAKWDRNLCRVSKSTQNAPSGEGNQFVGTWYYGFSFITD